jgi:acyl-CoA synthetase (NDP forming)/RimJ/RimL family protein N-acetyltransferase
MPTWTVWDDEAGQVKETAVTSPTAGISTYALLNDGSTVEIRAARPQDAEAVREMHAAMSPDNIYLRFFSLSPISAEREGQRVARKPDLDHAVLTAWLGKRLVGVASYEPTAKPGVAEIAFAVPDDMHRRGIATLLLEHLVSLARRRGLRAFTALTLSENAAMLRVFAEAGLPVQREFADGVFELTFPLPGNRADQTLDAYLASVASRESRADVASLSHLLRPASIAVVGASREPGSVGRAILRNIVSSGFGGIVHAVNPRAPTVEGVRCVASIGDLPQSVDLAVIAVPPSAVPEAAAECGRRGVRCLIVITTGLGAHGADLLAICRRHGMRLVGPNCFGVIVPPVGLNATFAARRPAPGVAGVVTQSGGLGVALLEQLSRLGIGVSSFVSVGDKYDVSSNDLLTWWAQDGVTRMAVLYVESFGSPRKFARTARRVGSRMPVLTVVGGRSAAGQRAAASHTAATATPRLTQEALFGQAGVIVTTSLGELVGASALLACQPLPAGNRVAIVSNAGGVGVLAADACGDNGLQVARVSEVTRRRLRRLLPAGAAVSGPVDTTAAVSDETFRACLEAVAADEGVDAVLAVAVPTAIADLRTAVITASVGKPVAVVLVDQPESVRLLATGDGPAAGRAIAAAGDDDPAAGREAAATSDADPAGRIVAVSGLPAYAYPEGAARALGHAARYRAWLDRQHGTVPELPGLRAAEAEALIAGFLAREPAGGWLPLAQAADLLSCYGIPLALGAAVPPSSPAGPVASDGVEVLIGVRQEPVFGPVVVFGLGGAATGVFGGQAARLTPLTDTDADELIRGTDAAPLLSGVGAQSAADADAEALPPADTGALADVLLRVSRLADDLPEVAELELNPVVARPDGVRVAGVRVRVGPAESPDPFLRRLR